MIKFFAFLILGCFIALPTSAQIVSGTSNSNNEFAFVRFPNATTIRIVSATGSLSANNSGDLGPLPQGDGMDLATFLTQFSADWAISGGFLGSFDPVLPIGFLKIDGEILVRPSVQDAKALTLLDGAFCTSGSTYQIYDSTGWTETDWLKNTKAWYSCVQSGPVLIENNKLYSAGFSPPMLARSPNRYALFYHRNRNPFVCIDMHDNLVFGLLIGRLGESIHLLTDAGPTFPIVAPHDTAGIIDWLKKPNFPNCKIALRMTGGDTGGLWSTDPNAQFGSSSIDLPDAVVANVPKS